MYFNSRPHEEVDLFTAVNKIRKEVFQLTTSRRGRPESWTDSGNGTFHFNSRPHEEVDAIAVFRLVSLQDISTHDLTKRSTTICNICRQTITFQLTTSRRGRLTVHMCVSNIIQISTHDLTKRSTFAALVFMAISLIFQLTTSRRGRQLTQIKKDEDNEFQLTTSRRGRREVTQLEYNPIEFQLTTSRRGRRDLRSLYDFTFLFQLTTSRRGRLLNVHQLHNPTDISTHDLTKRSTLATNGTLQFPELFQLTTSRRGRQYPKPT